jgi:hypothetical protein
VHTNASCAADRVHISSNSDPMWYMYRWTLSEYRITRDSVGVGAPAAKRSAKRMMKNICSLICDDARLESAIITFIWIIHYSLSHGAGAIHRLEPRPVALGPLQ